MQTISRMLMNQLYLCMSITGELATQKGTIFTPQTRRKK